MGVEEKWASPEQCIAAHVARGAAAGAGVGALTALGTGNKKDVGKGAVIGGVTGAFISFAYAYGKCFAQFAKVKSEATKDYSETKKELTYNPAQGEKVKITSYYIDPSAVEPGTPPQVRATYYVMTPQEKDIAVTETVSLKIFNPETNQFELVGSTTPEETVIKPTERKSFSELPMPANAEEGEFIIVFTVKYNNISDSMETPLVITRDQTLIAKAKKESLSRQKHGAPQVAANQRSSKGEKSVGAPIQAEEGKYVVIIHKKASLRENPENKAKLIMKASKGDKYLFINTITVRKTKWYQLKLDDGSTPWVISTDVKIVKE